MPKKPYVRHPLVQKYLDMPKDPIVQAALEYSAGMTRAADRFHTKQLAIHGKPAGPRP